MSSEGVGKSPINHRERFYFCFATQIKTLHPGGSAILQFHCFGVGVCLFGCVFSETSAEITVLFSIFTVSERDASSIIIIFSYRNNDTLYLGNRHERTYFA